MKADRRMVRLPMVVGGLAIALTLAACGSSTSSESTPAAASEAPAAASAAPAASAAAAPSEAPAGVIDVGVGTITPHHKDSIAYLFQSADIFSFTRAVRDGAVQAAADLGVTLDQSWNNHDPALELSSYQQALSSGKYGGIIMQPVTTQLCKSVAEDSVKYQVLIEVYATPVCVTGTETGEDMWAPGTIGYVDGQNMLPTILDMMNQAKAIEGDGPKKVLMVLGNEGHGNVVAFEEAWKAFAADNPDWTLSNKVYTDWTTPGAYSSTQNLLQADPNIDVIFSPYIDVSAGVVKAIADQKLTDKIAVFETSGGSKVSVDLVNKGQIKGSMPQLPYEIGYNSVVLMVEALNGKQPPKFTVSDAASKLGLLTKDNVADYTPGH